jgi:cytochrome c oxidase accessory protein FixG
VLLDKNSMAVMYDFKRGEPRGPVALHAQRSTNGDCIDCAACVKVCPTGIDIRNGTQLECVNCTACMDACDRVMERMKYPTGLIRYASQDQITAGGSRKITPRIILYSAVFFVLLAITTTLLILRTEVEASILRTTGSLYEELADGTIRNLYTIRVTNKTSRSLSITLKLAGSRGTILLVGPELDVPPQGQDQSVFTISIPKEQLYTTNTPMVVELYSNEQLLEKVHTTFDGPTPGDNK